MDPLFELRNLFALGNFQAAINEAESQTGSLEADLDVERRAYMYRAYVAQGKPEVVLQELGAPQGLPAALRAVGLLAAFTIASKSGIVGDATAQVLGMLKDFLAEGNGAAAGNPLVAVIAAAVYTLAGDLQGAMRCVFSSENLEARASLVQVYLLVGRPDAAEPELRAMQKLDDLNTWTQLAQAAVALSLPASNADRIKEAHQIYQELGDRFGFTPKLLNGLAVTQMLQGDHASAEKNLQLALEKDSRNGDTLANLVVTSMQLGKSQEIIDRQIRMLSSESPNHPWLVARKQAEANLKAAAAKYAARS